MVDIGTLACIYREYMQVKKVRAQGEASNRDEIVRLANALEPGDTLTIVLAARDEHA